MAHDVFISYAFEDKPTADAVCAELEGAGFRCWIAPRDILPGVEFSEAIIRALDNTRVLVLLFTARSNESPHVTREVAQAVKRGIPVVPLRLERVPMSPSMEYYISTPHWLDAVGPPLNERLERLTETVRQHMERRPGPGPAMTATLGIPDAKRVVVRPATRAGSALAAFARRPTPLTAGVVGTVAIVAVVLSVQGGALTGARSTAPSPTRADPTSVAVTPGPSASALPPTAGPTAVSSGAIPTATPYVPDIVIEPGVDAPGDQVGGIAWDGSDLWTAAGSELFRIDTTGGVLGVFTPPDYTPEGLTWDGNRFWMFATNAGSIYRFSLDKERPAANPSVAKVIDSPIRTIGGGANHGLAWDGSGLWLSDFYNVYRLDTSGNVVETLSFGDEVNGVAWDGHRLWIAVNHVPADDAELIALDAEGRATESHEIPVVEVFSMTWAGDAFLVAAAFDFADDPMIFRIIVPGAGS